MTSRLITAALAVLTVSLVLVPLALRGEPVIPAAVSPSENAGGFGEPDRVLRGAPDGQGAFDATSGSPRRVVVGTTPDDGSGNSPAAGAPPTQGPPAASSADTPGLQPSHQRPSSGVDGGPQPSKIAHKALGRPVRPSAAAKASTRPLRASARPQTAPVAGGRALTGTASWFCLPGRSACTAGFPASGAYAAAGPRLRAALGPGWRGREVLVTADGVSVTVKLSDWCSCVGGYLLDLYASVFGQLARNGLGQGVVDVVVTW